MSQPWTCAKCDQPILKGQPFTTAIVPRAVAQPRRRLRKGPGSQERRGLQKALDRAVWRMRWSWTVTTPSVTAVPDGPCRRRQRTLATSAATCLPKRAGVPPAATWSVQPERILHLLPRLLPVGLCGVAEVCRRWCLDSCGALCPLALRELPDFLLRHRLQPRQKGFHLPLRRVIGQDDVLRLRLDDVGHPVVQARRAPPGNGEPAERHTTAPSDFCQRLPARFHEAPLLARRL